MLTTFDADEFVVRGLEAGAIGFLLKDSSPAEIVDAILHVHAGEGMLSPSVARQLIAIVAGDGEAGARRAAARARLAELSPRERDVALAIGRGAVQRRDRRARCTSASGRSSPTPRSCWRSSASTTACRSRCSSTRRS